MSRNDAEYDRLSRSLEEEVEAARAVVADLLQSPSAYLHRAVPIAWRTMGMVEALGDAARDTLERDPEKSESLARFATGIAPLLGARYPSVLRAQCNARAWKELANAYRYRGSHEAALRALDRADAVLDEEFALAEDRAIIDLARATTLRDMHRLADAEALLASAAAVFHEHRSNARVAQCELLRGMISHGAKPVEAREAYRRAAAAATAAGDAQTVASAYSNLAVLDAEAGRTGAALDHLQQARAVFEELQAYGEICRTTWAVGFALVRAGQYVQAIGPLAEARRTFQKLGMTEEGGLAGIHLGEAYLALRNYSEAQELVSAIMAEFRQAGLNERALAALRYLRERGAKATAKQAREVAAYLERLRREPTLRFVPLNER